MTAQQSQAIEQITNVVDKLDETIVVSMNRINDKLDELLDMIAQVKKGAQ